MRPASRRRSPAFTASFTCRAESPGLSASLGTGDRARERAQEGGPHLLLLVEELEHVLHVHEGVLDHPGRGGKEQREGFGEHTLTQALPGMGQHYL